MKLQFFNEPELDFARGAHVCPRHGIAYFDTYDSKSADRRTEIAVGAVGTAEGIESLAHWLERCASPIRSDRDAKHRQLVPDFIGMRPETGYKAQFVFGQPQQKPITNKDVQEVAELLPLSTRIEKAVELYFDQIKFLCQNRPVDVIVCVIPELLYKALTIAEEPPTEESLEPAFVLKETNFRRWLKAKTMMLGKPLQIAREKSLTSAAKGQQDDAEKAWNFCTALYYKFSPTVPWRAQVNQGKPSTCAVGVSFFRSRDYQSLNTSLAQVFDELGNGLILRGSPVDIDKRDRVPHLTEEQSADLLSKALREYKTAMNHYPGRLVMHKSSRYSDAETAGFRAAASHCGVSHVDFLTIYDSDVRLFRSGDYPVYRGTALSLTDRQLALYTRGSVFFYKTYPGLYVPRALDVRIVSSEESPSYIANEILALSKMNWNNTRFDGKYPVTLGCSRRVGEILKYLEGDDSPQVRYAFYM